ncbi:MAG: hypothetical protein NW216_07015 [Hyphomicrobium sp.]|nr:hypothetical protein [Hyphomicrobium sp.]
MTPDHVNPLMWQQAQGVARQSCARFFRDGGSPTDAMRAFGLAIASEDDADWSRAVDRIAASLCASPQRRAA